MKSELLGQDCYGMGVHCTSGQDKDKFIDHATIVAEQAEQVRQNGTGRTGQAEQNSQNRTGRTGQPEEDS
jgi:hypothetical protein